MLTMYAKLVVDCIGEFRTCPLRQFYLRVGDAAPDTIMSLKNDTADLAVTLAWLTHRCICALQQPGKSLVRVVTYWSTTYQSAWEDGQPATWV